MIVFDIHSRSVDVWRPHQQDNGCD